MTQTSRVIWFNDDVISFRDDTHGKEFKSGDSVTGDSNDSSTFFKITLKDTSKHWPTGSRFLKFQLTDPENPQDPMYLNGIYNDIYSDHFYFTASNLYSLFTSVSQYAIYDRENSFHFNGLLDSNNQVIQDKDIVTNNSNVVATSSYSSSSQQDHITITAKSGYKITSVKMYTRLSDGAKFKDYTSSLDSKGNLDIRFNREPIPTTIDNDFYNQPANIWGYYAKVTTVQTTEPTIDLKVSYNNGLTTVNDLFPGQKAGTITGIVSAGKGYSITGVTSAYYQNPNTGFQVNLSNFTATKISDYQYSYSFTLTDINIKTLNSSNKTVYLRVHTEKEPGNINIDSTNLEHCSVSPSTVIQGKKTVLTLNADSGYILNGTGSYSVDDTPNSFMCNNISSYQITVTANTSISITFAATKIETKPSSIVHTYVLDQENYNNIGKQIIEGVNSTATGFNQYDYTKFVNYLYAIPFKVETEITTSTRTINLGKKNLDIDCRKVTHETLDIDLGTIDLTSMANSHDYKPINITLYCPFSNNIVLPLTVLGSKLNLSFTINLKSEQATLLIKQNDNVVYSGQTELFTDLPLYFTAGLQDTLIKRLKTQYQNTIKQAYIIVSYNKPITNLTSYKTTEHGMLSNYKGFTRISRGTLKQSVSSAIDNGILNLLSQGVIIK